MLVLRFSEVTMPASRRTERCLAERLENSRLGGDAFPVPEHVRLLLYLSFKPNKQIMGNRQGREPFVREIRGGGLQAAQAPLFLRSVARAHGLLERPDCSGKGIEGN